MIRVVQIFFFLLTVISVKAQLIQGTIKPGTGSSVELWIRPNFNNSTQYLYQIGMPVAIPATATPFPTLNASNVTLDASFTSTFGSNYTITVNPVANNTGNTEKYYNTYHTL